MAPGRPPNCISTLHVLEPVKGEGGRIARSYDADDRNFQRNLAPKYEFS